MAVSAAELQILLTARDDASGRLQGLGREVNHVEAEVDKASGAFGRLSGVVGKLGGIGLAGAGIGALVSGFQGAFDAVSGLVGSASDLNEQVSKSGAVFGEAAQEVQAFAKTTAQSLGISQTAALEAAGSFGVLFKTAGLSDEAAAGMSTDLVKLAADLASFNNIDPSEALDKLRSGLVGESEPLRSVGILLSEDAVKAKALELGLGGAGRELSEQEKVVARYRLVMEQSGRAQGDFQRTSTGLANSMRIIRASFENVRTEIGGALLPTVTRLVQAFVQQLPAITAAVQAFAAQVAPILERVFSGDLAGGLQDVAARLGPILASWSEAFWGWVGEMTPPLLQRLGELGGAIFAWIKAQGPPFLEHVIGEWVPAFIDWVVAVLPPLLTELGKVVAALADWATTTGRPELEALGLALGAALVAGFGKALEQLGPKLAEAIQNAVTGGRAGGAGGPLRPDLTDPLVRARSGLPPLVSPAAQAAAAGGGGGPTVVNVGNVEVTSGGDPQQVARDAGDAVAAQVLDALVASAGSTDPGASNRLQGNLR